MTYVIFYRARYSIRDRRAYCGDKKPLCPLHVVTSAYTKACLSSYPLIRHPPVNTAMPLRICLLFPEFPVSMPTRNIALCGLMQHCSLLFVFSWRDRLAAQIAQGYANHVVDHPSVVEVWCTLCAECFFSGCSGM